MKLSNFSLSYSSLFQRGEMDAFGFLALSRELGVEGASFHVQDLGGTSPEQLRRVRRAYLDHGLAVSLLAVSTDFGRAGETIEAELAKAREAVRVASFLGAPVLRIFAGSPPNEVERERAFDRAVQAVRRLCAEAAEAGIPIGLQNHDHVALTRTGAEVLRFIQAVDHPNLTFVLDTGQFAGSRGASGEAPVDLLHADFMDSIRATASLARHVRFKLYAPRIDGSEPWIDYPRVIDILRGVHYPGFVDIVYEPQSNKTVPQEDARTAIPRFAGYLRWALRPAGGGPDTPPAATPPRYAGLETRRHFETTEPRTETEAAFLEGPAVDRDGSVYFTNIAADQILRWDPAARKSTVVRERSNGANGLAFDADGRLVVCEGGGRVVRIDLKSGELAVLADAHEGRPLGSPNDLVIDSSGRIYFTSRLPNRDPGAGNVNAVYRIEAPGRLVRVLAWPQIDMPNGIDLSPDEKTLYLIDADGREGGARRIRAYELRSDGSTGAERLLFDFSPGRSGDGLAIDVAGNLYVAAGLHRTRGTAETLDTRPGIHVISPAGKLLAFLETPEDTATNCAFGGPDLRTLYITCGKRLLSVRTAIPGWSGRRP